MSRTLTPEPNARSPSPVTKSTPSGPTTSSTAGASGRLQSTAPSEARASATAGPHAGGELVALHGVDERALGVEWLDLDLGVGVPAILVDDIVEEGGIRGGHRLTAREGVGVGGGVGDGRERGQL